MNQYWLRIILAVFLCVSSRVIAALSIGAVPPIFVGGGGPCWTSGLVGPLWPTSSSSNAFTLTGVSGVGVFTSGSAYVANDVSPGMGDHVIYHYNLDLSNMSGSNHCIKLVIHFSRPLACAYDVMLETNGNATIDVSSAILASFGDISFAFGGGCLAPGDRATPFEMLSDTQPKHGTVSISDQWTDALGHPQLTTINVPAIVPDIPPDWVYPLQLPNNILVPYPSFQGNIWCNEIPIAFPTNGTYKFGVQLLDGSNGFAASALVTQDVPVVNGLFTMPLPFLPTTFMGNPLWLSLEVMPPNGATFTQLGPPLPLTPTPQAYYAYAAGVVADLSPGQAVTSLNGLNDAVKLAAGVAVTLETNGNTLIINSSLGSDRNIKTGFRSVFPGGILEKLATLPIQTWHYTNELDNVCHLGPTAQDFRATFGLGASDKTIEIVDEGGVALAAIQGLNQKLQEKERQSQDQESRIANQAAELADLKQRNEALAQRLNQLERAVKSLTQTH